MPECAQNHSTKLDTLLCTCWGRGGDGLVLGVVESGGGGCSFLESAINEISTNVALEQ